MKNQLATALIISSILLVKPQVASGQVGFLHIEGSSEPNSATVTLAEMIVEITLDHLHATVKVTQIFENQTPHSLRGRYELALGHGAAVSGFALWEGEHRRQAMVVDRRNGQRVFEELTHQNLDPGLLENSDHGPQRNIYAVQVNPISPFNRIRIDVEYSQELELVADEALFHFPLAGRHASEQEVEHLRVELQVDGSWPLENVELHPQDLRFIETQRNIDTGFRAQLDQRNVKLTDNLTVTLHLGRESGEPLRPALLAYRAASVKNGHVDRSSFGGSRHSIDELGYFVVRTPIQLRRQEATSEGYQDLVIALDTSLSMRGGKLERAVAAVEDLLQQLRNTDRFTLMTFNDEVSLMSGRLEPASAERIAEARRFFREGYLSGGTDFRRALPKALEVLTGSTANRRTVVVVTDGNPSLGSLESSTIATEVERANIALGGSRGRLFILGVGDDANHTLLEEIANDSDGLYVHVGESADFLPIIRRFIHRLDAPALEEICLHHDTGEGITDLYIDKPTRVYDGSSYSVFGRYATPIKNAHFRLSGRRNSTLVEKIFTGNLPRRDRARRWIARGWAQRRIADLQGRIDSDGEREEWVQEIIALAREHLLVTPYTSLISTVRSSLRPREIAPGDPVLRVRTDPTDRAVTALFPFGLIKSLRRQTPGLFETRFLAPISIPDGRHDVDLIITGADGRHRVLRDHFLIDSEAPQPSVEAPDRPVRSGKRLQLRARSPRDTRQLHAFLRTERGAPVDEARPAELHWSQEASACIGELQVPESLPTGNYRIVVIAEDQAHHVGSTSVPVEVLGR